MTRKFISFFLSLILVLSSMCAMYVNVGAAAVTPESGNIYYIKNKNSGLYLTVENDSASAGANVCQATGTGSLGQRWILEQNSNGTYRLHPATDMTGGLSLDLANGSLAGGANIQIWTNNGLSPQNFGITASGDGYAITTEPTSHAMCLDVLNFSTESGANVIQWTNNATVNQIWYFEQASWPSTSSSSSSSSSSSTTTTTTSSSSSSSTATSSKSWNMSDTSFRSLGTISSTTSVDGINLIATSSKTMAVTSSSATLDGTTYNYCLALGGAGSTSYRAVSMDIDGTTTVKVTAKSSGSATRTLAVVNGSGTQVGSISCGSSLATGSVSITGTGTLYIYSTGSGTNISKIQANSLPHIHIDTSVPLISQLSPRGGSHVFLRQLFV